MDASLQYERRGDLTASTEEVTLPGVSFLDLAEHFHRRRNFVLLETQSAAGGGRGAWSLLSFEPFAHVRACGSDTRVRVNGDERVSREDPLEAVETFLRRHALRPPVERMRRPFAGGAIGYLAYELGRRLEAVPETAVNDLAISECDLGFYNFAVVLDHDSGRMHLCHVSCRDEALGWSRERIWSELRRVRPGTCDGSRRAAAKGTSEVPFVPSLDRQQYLDAVGRIKEYILAGDVYQVNMTLRFRADIGAASAWDIYRLLGVTNPAPYAAYLNCDDYAVVCSSPELFLQVDGRSVVTRPIKGTIRRSDDLDEDRTNRLALLNSAKNRAELAMIVDLLRNDLGRVCRPGSIHVETFPELETYPSLHHLVATIAGTLEPHASVVDVIRATFPGGSITGAPKIRAMEIIDECEPVARGVYTGSIGCLGFDGSAALNIAIRTLIVKCGTAYIHAGGGIVADSVPDDEYDELLLKASRLFAAVGALA